MLRQYQKLRRSSYRDMDDYRSIPSPLGLLFDMDVALPLVTALLRLLGVLYDAYL